MLKSRRFRLEREADWKRLDDLLTRLEKGRASSLSDDEVIAIPVLYRSALSSLAVARAISLDKSLVDYLESLSARAYFCVYSTRTTVLERVIRFFAQDWPMTVRALWAETLVALGLTLLGTVAAYLLVQHSSQWFYDFVPAWLIQGRDPSASTAELAQTLHGVHGPNGLGVLATALFTHNAGVAMLAFALGFACGLPTAFFMLQSGLMMGGFFALFAQHGLGVEVGGWLSIHSTTEIFAVTLAGAAGFHVGWSLAFPRGQSRVDALASAGKRAAVVMAGVVVMLAVAGILEGYGRQLIDNTPLRYGIGWTVLAAWCAYFYLPKARR
jgi:uncharacterized membrane protein SpoIIM required for sporulation